MRKAARTDGNQAAIVKALREAGASVQILAAVGQGCPDLLVGHTWRGDLFNDLMEVKDPSKPKADQCLTPDQVKWHAEWKGQKAVVYTVEDALRVIGGDAMKHQRESMKKTALIAMPGGTEEVTEEAGTANFFGHRKHAHDGQ